ncbi:MAG: hypothetical protein HQ581_26265, partial [Planctomycetes bacterium]|nr:hypothetical protein [Planctomycetota bacterium]
MIRCAIICWATLFVFGIVGCGPVDLSKSKSDAKPGESKDQPQESAPGTPSKEPGETPQTPEPAGPTEPEKPTGPEEPVEPAAPVEQPTEPEMPIEKPAEPVPPAIKTAIERINDLGREVQYDPDNPITTLDLEMMPTTDADLELLTALPELKKLLVWGAEISDAGIPQLTKFPNLVDLTVYNTEITDEGVALLAGIKTLKSLNLRRSTNVTDAALEHIATLPNLQYLHLLYNNFTNDGMEHVGKLTKLRLL